MITRFQVQNYKALRDVTLNLTPMHVLIGPNDAGKTSILEAITALCRSVDYPLEQAFTGSWQGFDLVWQHTPNLPVSLGVAAEEEQRQFEYQLSCLFTPGRTIYIQSEYFKHIKESRTVDLPRSSPHTDTSVICSAASTFPLGIPTDNELQATIAFIHRALSGVHFYRWEPRFLALPVAPDAKRRFRMDSTGFGLALFLDDIPATTASNSTIWRTVLGLSFHRSKPSDSCRSLPIVDEQMIDYTCLCSNKPMARAFT